MYSYAKESSITDVQLMAELDAAAELELLGDATGTVGVEHIDESALLGDRITPPSTTNGVKKEDVDLYDDAIAPSGGDKGTDFVTTPARSTPNTTSTNTITASVSYTSEGKKYCCYVGNLTWWTTEADLTDTLSGIESKAFSGSSRSKHRDRSRSRSRERDRKRRRRSRSRSR
uniref:Tudor domain-containing protein n=1 Tax=Heterorhabditis bacteriophora TaxID=37862 RepID=A0A1I7WML4_HETBA